MKLPIDSEEDKDYRSHPGPLPTVSRYAPAPTASTVFGA